MVIVIIYIIIKPFADQSEKVFDKKRRKRFVLNSEEFLHLRSPAILQQNQHKGS